MDPNGEEVLQCLRVIENSEGEEEEEEGENGIMENGHFIMRNHCYLPINKKSLHWLELRVFFVRLSQCVIDDGSTPELLTLQHVPLNQHTLLEVNGSRSNIYSDGISTLLKRDILDKRSEEITFVSTNSIRTTGSMKFEVLHKHTLVLSGTLDFGVQGESKEMSWSMSCDSDFLTRTKVLKESRNHYTDLESSPAIEVYVAGCFSGSPIVLTKTLHLCHRRKTLRKGVMLETIPENETTQSLNNLSDPLPMQPRNTQHEEIEMSRYLGMQFTEGEDGELSWFNAGVRVGVGISLSICLGLGIGAGLLIRTYQGTTRNFRRRLL